MTVIMPLRKGICHDCSWQSFEHDIHLQSTWHPGVRRFITHRSCRRHIARHKIHQACLQRSIAARKGERLSAGHH